MNDDVEALLALADEQMAGIEELYGESLAEKQVSSRLQALIKNVIENYRSALDYVANAAAEKYAKPGRVYWPYAPAPSDFPRHFDKNFPGLRNARPEIAAAWERCQPYQTGYDWLGALFELAKDNKHRALSPQKRVEQRRREA